jgi:hypothetical protein
MPFHAWTNWIASVAGFLRRVDGFGLRPQVRPADSRSHRGGAPEDRRDAARAYIEQVGGTLNGFWYGFGQ